MGKGKSGDYFIDVLIGLHKGNGELSIDRETVKAAFQDAIGAGTGTSAGLLSWAMTELIKHPDIMKKVQDEVQGIVGERQCMTDEDYEKMDYVRAVLKETLRLHPTVPLTLRETTESFTLRGYEIPAGAFLWVNFWAIHRDPTNWDEPENFKPERFLTSSGEYQGYFPFGFGRRICPGMSFAYATTERVLANLVHKFEWQLPNGMKPKDMDVSEKVDTMTLERKVPLMLMAKKRFA
ncbi:cytochrome P450 71A8-like [Andrographis paniculata]|uniref:cytochrome P450 71A8-like n=1 Tax=Andrographis paniculata TaxID=175694 RepID=UPI0021E73A38|nr:cytochrome P450 71A8-like [Andrographis paniculata]